jgi:hypothetical protein
MKDKVPSYQVPERSIVMLNGEVWKFRFDNRALHMMDRLYDGNPSSIQMLHCLSAQQQHLNGGELTFDAFLDVMPPMIDPEVQSRVNALMAEVKEKQAAVSARVGNEQGNLAKPNPSASDSAGPAATTSAEPSSQA